jgi:ferredoxin
MIHKLLGKILDVARRRPASRHSAPKTERPAAQSEPDPIALPDCQVTFVDHDKTIAVHRGKTVLHAIIRGGIPLPHECGGLASCGECHVSSITGDVSDRREIETRILKILGRPLDGRLACQTLVFGAVSVTIAGQA